MSELNLVKYHPDPVFYAYPDIGDFRMHLCSPSKHSKIWVTFSKQEIQSIENTKNQSSYISQASIWLGILLVVKRPSMPLLNHRPYLHFIARLTLCAMPLCLSQLYSLYSKQIQRQYLVNKYSDQYYRHRLTGDINELNVNIRLSR